MTKPLSEMTLLDLASAVALADNGPDHDRYTRELVRRQAMLDAAEGMANTASCLLPEATALHEDCAHGSHWESLAAAKTALSAYAAAKRKR